MRCWCSNVDAPRDCHPEGSERKTNIQSKRKGIGPGGGVFFINCEEPCQICVFIKVIVAPLLRLDQKGTKLRRVRRKLLVSQTHIKDVTLERCDSQILSDWEDL